MNLIDLITFFITIVFLFILVGRRIKEEKKRRNHPEQFEEKEEEPQEEVPMRQFLREYDLEIVHEEEKKVTLPPIERPPRITYPNAKHEESHRTFYDEATPVHIPLSPAIEFPEEGQQGRSARALSLLKELPSLQDAIVLQTILAPPKGIVK